MSETPQPRQERDRLDRRPVVAFLAVVAAVSLAGVAGSRQLLRAREDSLRPTRGETPTETVPGPLFHGLVKEEREGQRARAAAEASLERWAWVDRDRGIVRMPIERALTLVEEESR